MNCAVLNEVRNAYFVCLGGKKVLRPYGNTTYNLRPRRSPRNNMQGNIEDGSFGSESSSEDDRQTHKKRKRAVGIRKAGGATIQSFDVFQEKVQEEPDQEVRIEMVQNIRKNLEGLQGSNKAKNRRFKEVYDQLINSL